MSRVGFDLLLPIQVSSFSQSMSMRSSQWKGAEGGEGDDGAVHGARLRPANSLGGLALKAENKVSCF